MSSSNIAAAANGSAKPPNRIVQPPWHSPTKWSTEQPKLRVMNSLTKQKEEFIPSNQKQITWYACGPTVYAPSHMGHARTYISFDIIRRILEDYFGYNVLYVMNITDVDDKIIIEARQKLLFTEFKNAQTTLDVSLIQYVKTAWEYYVREKFEKFSSTAASNWKEFESSPMAPGSAKAPTFEDEPKYEMYFKISKACYDAISAATATINPSKEAADVLCEASRSVLSLYLDKQKGHSITDPKHFREFAAHWEGEFFKDMDKLNIKRPDVLTRVTEYVPEIVEFVEKIIGNKYAYESDGSVYFDTVGFDSHPDCHYAKLEPWSAGNVKLIQEGEGDLSSKTTEKRHKSDFALWKKSKPGEPAWPSPWGAGRPGWHIECSVMASHVLGANIDIHSGGVDLAFPHHDNELAQSEAYHKCPQWINYFWHTGHLHIEGQKMSKSLKNFISIREALEKYTMVQIRIMFLSHNWDSTLDFKESSLQDAKDFENRLNNFFTNVKAEINRLDQQPPEFTGKHDFGHAEKALSDFLQVKQASIHTALCDSFNTPTVMSDLRDLLANSNSYMMDKVRINTDNINPNLIMKIAKYIMKMLRIFGVASEDISIGINAGSKAASGGNIEDAIMPFLKVLSDYRDEVRSLSQKKAEHRLLLELCDKVRDIDLVDLGVALDDRADGKALVKFVEKEILLQQREEKKQRELQKQKEREIRLQEEAKKKAEKLEKAKTPPNLLFRDEQSIALYSQWDENGIPTHDKEGAELTKGKKKQNQKLYDMQKDLHQKFVDGKLF